MLEAGASIPVLPVFAEAAAARQGQNHTADRLDGWLDEARIGKYPGPRFSIGGTIGTPCKP